MIRKLLTTVFVSAVFLFGYACETKDDMSNGEEGLSTENITKENGKIF